MHAKAALVKVLVSLDPPKCCQPVCFSYSLISTCSAGGKSNLREHQHLCSLHNLSSCFANFLEDAHALLEKSTVFQQKIFLEKKYLFSSVVRIKVYAMATCKKFERCPFSPKNAFKLKKSKEEIKYEFYFFNTKILYSKSLLSCSVWGFILCLGFFLFGGGGVWLVYGTGNINDNLVTYAQ